MATKFEEKVSLIFDVDDREYRAAASRLKRQAKKDGKAIRRNLFALAGISAAGTFAVKVAAEFEKGLAGVKKTTGLTGKSLQKLGDDIRALSRETQFSTDVLLATTQAAGQLGVEGGAALTKYTEIIAKLGTASDLSGEQAAFALARFSAATGTAHEDVDRLASSLVALGNSYATTEAEAIETANAIAAKASVYGLSAQAALGLAAALNAVNLGGEAAGTTFSKLLAKVQVAVQQGGPQLQKFAEIMGVEVAEVARMMEEDVDGLVIKLLQGLNQYGNKTTAVLRDLGITEERVLARLATLSKNIDLTTGAVEDANEAWTENNALQKEYKVLADTLTEQFAALRNKAADLGREIGLKLAPAARTLVDALNSYFGGDEGKERLATLAKYIVLVGKLTAAFLAAKVIVLSLKLAWTGFLATRALLAAYTTGVGAFNTILALTKVAAHAARIAFVGMWGAATLGLTTLLYYAPDIWAYFTKLDGWIARVTNGFAQFGKIAEIAWASFFGSEEEVAKLKEEFRLLITEAERMKRSKRGASHGSMDGFSPGSHQVKGGPRGQQQEEADAAAVTGSASTAPGRGPATEQFGPNPFNRISSKEKLDLALKTADQITKREALERQRRHDEQMASEEEVWAEWRKEKAAERAEELADIREQAQADELQAQQMHFAGIDAQLVAFWEREQELKRQLREAELIEEEEQRQAEIDRINHQLQLIANAREHWRQQDRKADAAAAEEKRKLDQKATQQAITTLVGRSKTMSQIQEKWARAQAIYTLLTKMPGFAAEGFGQAVAALPPPFGQIVGAASAAAVMAQQALGLNKVKSVQPPGLREGGMIGGGFSLGDSQLRMVKPGEVMIPDKKWSAVEGAIAESMKRGDYEDDDRALPARELNEERVQIQFDGEAGALLRRLDDQTAVLRTG